MVGSGLIIAFCYEDEISKYIVSEINKNLRAEVKVDKINFTVFKKFPDASVEFVNVVVKSAKGFNKNEFYGYRPDTLVSAKNVFLQFNLIDIFKKKYKIKKIHVIKGNISLFTDRKGKDNYHFWKSGAASDTSSFQLKLKKITFSEVKFIYVDHLHNICLQAHSKDFSLKGDFTSDSYTLSTKGELFADNFTMDNIHYIKSEDVSVIMEMGVKNNNFTIEKGRVSVADLNLDVSGNINVQNKNTVNLSIKGENINIQSFLSLLPEKYDRLKKDYTSDGNFYFETHLSGVIDSANFIHIESQFGIENGVISKAGSNLKLAGISFDGAYSNGAKNCPTSSFIRLQKVKSKIGSGNISGEFLIENLDHSKIEFNADADIKLNELQEFFKFDIIKNIDGILKANVKFAGAISDLNKLTTEDFRNSRSNGMLILEKMNLEIKDDPRRYTNINGIFTFDNNDLEINSLSLNVQDNDFKIKGILKNMVSYFMVSNQKYSVEGEVACSNLNMNQVLQEKPGDTKSGLKVSFPEDVTFNVDLSVANFIFSGFSAKNVKGNLVYKSKVLSAENVSLQAPQGSITGDCVISQNAGGNISVKAHTNLDKLNIQNTFASFNNFGQDFIKDKHLKGIVTADVNLSSEWSPELKCDLKKLVVISTVLIKNGELNDFKPMEELARFINLNDLKSIKFSDLKNDILIKDEKIMIPQMDINSSAIDLTLSGEQTFDNKIDYRLKVLLSDVLFKKAKKNKKENEEFGIIEDDGLGKTSLHLIIRGTTDNFKITYDTKKMKENIKEAVKEEKKNLKTILNEEFGLFKNDTSILNNKKKKEEEEKKKKQKKIRVKWDEESEGEKDRSDEK